MDAIGTHHKHNDVPKKLSLLQKVASHMFHDALLGAQIYNVL